MNEENAKKLLFAVGDALDNANSDLKTFLHSIDGIHGVSRPSITEEISMGEYDVYEEITKQYKPKTILEIGVLFGYSSIAMIMGCHDVLKEFIGYDTEKKTKNSNAIAGMNINLLFQKLDIMDRRGIVKFTNVLNLGVFANKYDIVHIDGDHSFKGCYSDLQKFYPASQKLVIVHDYFYKDCPDVRKAVDKFEKDIGGFKQKTEYKNKRGLILIEK